MKRARLSAGLLSAMLAVAGQPPTMANAQTAPAAPAIDSEAIDALNKMGAYLRTLNAFQVKATVTTEEVLTDGLKVQLTNTSDLIAERPNHLRLDVTSDSKQRLFLYDGKTFTLFAPRSSMYATVPAPATIAELADRLEEKYDIELPFVDLFRWGTPKSAVNEITVADYIGPSVVAGITCDHYVFRQPGLDWQIWIQSGDFPLPLKLVLTTTTDDARPQHSAVYAWNLAPSVSDDAFAFVPPKDAMKISIAEVDAMRAAAKKTKAGGQQ